MKIVLDKSDFIDALTPCMGTVSTKNTITSLEGILIETTNDEKVRVTSYDMNKGVRIVFDPVEIIETGSCIINAHKLFQMVKLMSDKEITIETDGSGNAKILSGKSSFSLFCMRGADFPALPNLHADRCFEMSSAMLKKMIGKVMCSVADNDSRPMLCGAYFKINGDKLEIVSCDSYTLAKCNINSDVNDVGSIGLFNISFILPGHALGELTKILSDKDERVRVMLTKKHAIIKQDNTILFTRMIDSEYIDYERIIPTEHTIFIEIGRENLLHGLERANLVAEEKIQGSARSYVKLTIKDSSLFISSTSANGRVYDEIECKHEGGELEIGFNCRYLINSVRSSEGDMLKLSFKSATQSVIIESVEKDPDSECFYMVLPVRMLDSEKKEN